ncbi:hypothetical protein RFI_32306 [Reticulomyxa filosa]|uniref:Uncharacterized protein n=1 Tax=Reticulomyxa filosa TaxID=46433 RepID=X6LVB8_RETFI|nr:hypothetical protein RFI_32306 [Reticulomyxa filosa]|eukprot:ETO05092.1 hypothetical protein RFI_32306 [Reticulomyxa filosa]
MYICTYIAFACLVENKKTMDVKRLLVGDVVEFVVDKDKGTTTNRNYQRAAVVTAPGGRPFCTHQSSYGVYLSTRLDLAKPQSSLHDCPSTGHDERFNGWITSFDYNTKEGTIEVSFCFHFLFLFFCCFSLEPNNNNNNNDYYYYYNRLKPLLARGTMKFISTYKMQF